MLETACGRAVEWTTCLLEVSPTSASEPRGNPAGKMQAPSNQLAGRGSTDRGSSAERVARLFYFIAALVLLGLTGWGFENFYVHGKGVGGREITPQIRNLVIVHGVIMTTWVLLFLVQAFLIVFKRHRVHMILGRLGAILAVGIVASGLFVAIGWLKHNPSIETSWGYTSRQFMAVPFFGILVFGAFVSCALWQRRRPEIHRSMMFFGTLTAVQAAIARIDPITQLYKGTALETFFGPYFGAVLVGAAFLLASCVIRRTFDRWFCLGFLAFLTYCILTLNICTTSAWANVADFLVR
jgi:hypothetical protein